LFDPLVHGGLFQHGKVACLGTEVGSRPVMCYVQVSGTRLGRGEAITLSRVREAPRQEIARCEAQALPRTLWGFEVCAGGGEAGAAGRRNTPAIRLNRFCGSCDGAVTIAA